MPFIWPEFVHGGDGIALVAAGDLPGDCALTGHGARQQLRPTMSGNTIGKLFTVTTFGESHGPALGCIVDGCPPGLPLAEADIQQDLERRRPGKSRHTTQRKEPDTVRILSGVFEGLTTGTPIGLLIENVDQSSKDYSEIKDKFRPGHADYTYQQKYGIRDYRGGGRSSARETAMRVAAGAIARKYLRERLGVEIRGYLRSSGRSASTWWISTASTTTRSSAPIRRACRSSRPTWTRCARKATPSARASTSSPAACRSDSASRCSTSSRPTSPTP